MKRISGGSGGASGESSTGKRSKHDVDGNSSDAVASGESVSSVGVDVTRMRQLNKINNDGTGPVLYWMSRDQRVADNWALLYAQQQAQAKRTPLVVCFNLLSSFLGATKRHFGFMLRGLAEVEATLTEKGIPFVLLQGDPVTTIPHLLREGGFSLLVCDFSPLRIGVKWRTDIASSLSIPVHEVDAHNVVPVWVASDHLEYAARTIRPKIHNHLRRYLTEFPPVANQTQSWTIPYTVSAEFPVDWAKVNSSLRVDESVPEVDWCVPGETAAVAALQAFLTRLGKYATSRNNPSLPGETCSGLSPYFHFGQLAPQRAALAVSALSKKHSEGAAAFLEEAVIRRELSDNYCFYNPQYDRLDGLYPQFGNKSWAQMTLTAHAKDPRQYTYTESELEEGKTHDELWNAAQLEMVHRGKMHGFMRMYWAKKILEWTPSPEEALRVTIALNDRYELDGRDPNGYVGCAWAIAGVHDNGWAERPVFGKIRYMNYEGCKRKFDISAYIQKVRSIVKALKTVAK